MRLFISIALTTLLAGCALLKPLPKETTVDDRLIAFPTSGLPLGACPRNFPSRSAASGL